MHKELDNSLVNETVCFDQIQLIVSLYCNNASFGRIAYTNDPNLMNQSNQIWIFFQHKSLVLECSRRSNKEKIIENYRKTMNRIKGSLKTYCNRNRYDFNPTPMYQTW